MENSPAIYVLAGPNGIGKTTLNPFFIPNGVPYINADDIARQLRERLGDINVQEIANAQALERMNEFIAKRKGLAIETNLADKETWQFLIGVQGLGYALHLNFFGVSDIDICINRVFNRVPQGGHFVQPDIVRMRYEAGLKLLRHYKNIPNRLILTDNTTESVNCAELSLGKVLYKIEYLPAWVEFVLSDDSVAQSEVSSLDAIREKYRRMRDGDGAKADEDT
jgi:predicted ABC-type ATPase